MPLDFNDLSVAVRWLARVLAVAANKAQLNGCQEESGFKASAAAAAAAAAFIGWECSDGTCQLYQHNKAVLME